MAEEEIEKKKGDFGEEGSGNVGKWRVVCGEWKYVW